MSGIYYKEGIYVVIDNDNENDVCVYHYRNRYNVSLLGGRIEIQRTARETVSLTVDGISIVKIDNKLIRKELSLSTIASHLNAIEAHGADAFIENYKKNIEFLYDELKDFRQKTEMQLTSEQDDSKIKSLLSKLEELKNLLFTVLAILFSLKNHMTAGLENEKVMSVCQSIMDSLS
jgi:Rad3-related DNA helicase